MECCCLSVALVVLALFPKFQGLLRCLFPRINGCGTCLILMAFVLIGMVTFTWITGAGSYATSGIANLRNFTIGDFSAPDVAPGLFLVGIFKWLVDFLMQFINGTPMS